MPRNHRNLDVLDAADQVADEINQLLDTRPCRLIHRTQLRKAAQAIGANISEGFGRRTRGERNSALSVAEGEAEETIRHLRANYASRRLVERTYWRLHNRLVTICRMLASLAKT